MAKKIKTIGEDEIQEVKQRATTMVSNAGALQEMFVRYREIYFMDNIEKPKNSGIDNNDWKLTASPSGRNAVTGMKRLMDTGEIKIIIKSNKEKHANSDEIERGLLKILSVSGEYRRARVEKDANLSAVLYGPVILSAESVADMAKVHKKSIYRARLDKIQGRTPFMIDTINAESSYSEWGKFGMLAHLQKQKIKGSALIERWGVDVPDKNNDYTVYDWIDPENRIVWADGSGMADNILMAKPHLMHDMNIVSRYAGGSSLFQEEERMLQSFLYAHAKGEWDKRENLFWTYLFTALYMQGLPGPLLIVDPDSVQGQSTIDVDYTGGVRKIIAKASTTNIPVVDRDTLEVKRLMDEINADSTIYKQTLGQNIQGSTYSGLAMLSNSGQLPLEDPKEAVQEAFRDIFDHMLCRIKYEGIDNEVIPPNIIPDEYDIEVMVEPKLPQDDLRNSQIAQGLGPLVSDEWKHTNILKIGDSKAMTREVIKDTLRNAMIQGIAQDPEIMKKLIASALPKILGQQQGPAMGGPAPTDQAMQAPGSEILPPDQSMPPAVPQDQAMMDQMSGPSAAPAGMSMPAPQEKTGPMVPPNERK